MLNTRKQSHFGRASDKPQSEARGKDTLARTVTPAECRGGFGGGEEVGSVGLSLHETEIGNVLQHPRNSGTTGYPNDRCAGGITQKSAI